MSVPQNIVIYMNKVMSFFFISLTHALALPYIMREMMKISIVYKRGVHMYAKISMGAERRGVKG